MEKDAPTAASAVEGVVDEEICTISSSRTTIDPTCIAPGMIVDYLGRQLDIISSSSSSTTNNNGLMATALKKDEEYNNNNNNNNSNNNEEGKLRPIFVPIPKISDIGLIDSPLITGITAIDALTPIGKGQNMLIIGTEEEEEEEGNDAIHRGEGGGLVDEKNKKVRGLNKRGWMINLLRNVITNHRRSSSTSANDANEVTNTKSKEMRCFYCLTSADQKVRARVLKDISNAGIRDEVVTVLSSSSATSSSFSLTSNDDCIGAAEAVAAAATACTLAEHHALTTGGDAIVIIDDINLHKTLWDITTRELVNVYGTNSVVEADLNGGSSSEMRGYFSGLIQRAARFNTKRGGGSVTLILLSTLPNPDETDMDGNKEDNDDDATTTYDASDFDTMSEKIRTRIRLLVSAKVPLTAANLRKIKLPIPRPSPAEDRRRLALQHIEDLISMSDGQVWLDVSMIGRSPPLDPSRSITRVGVGADTLTCRADAPALRSVVGSLRFEFQQALDLSPDTLSSSSSLKGIAGGEEDNDNARQVRRRDAFLLAMHQEVHEGRKLSHECTLLLAASRGHLDDVLAKGGKAGTSLGRDMIEGLLEYVTNETETGEIIRSIDKTLELSLEGRDLLENAIVSYFSKS
jgi:F-type H+-transporting ATPase subunit alpha